jgi:hypothetical protein
MSVPPHKLLSLHHPELQTGLRRNLLRSAIIDALCPFLVYRFAYTHTTPLTAIGLSMLPPAANNILTLIRKRRVDFIGVVVLLGLFAGLILFLLGGSPRLILVRDSLIGGVIGTLFLLSLLLHRPLLFYVVRQLSTGNDPEQAAAWTERYAHSRYRYGLPQLTLFWGAVLLGEAILRTWMALSLPISLYLAVSPISNFGIYGIAILCSLAYAKRMHDKEEQAAAPPEETREEAREADRHQA